MNLRQAYDGWSQQEQNRTLYVKTREAFRKAWFALPTNKPCSWYTCDVLALALAETHVIESDKVKAASVMVHVLTWANFAEPKWNPKPDFTMNDLTRLIHLPADELEKERERITAAMQCLPEREETDGDQRAVITEVKPTNNEESMSEKKQKRPRGKQPKPVAQIDAETLQVIKVWPSRGEAEESLGLSKIYIAVEKLRKAGGFYWSDPQDADTIGERLGEKQRQKDEQQQARAAMMRNRLAKAREVMAREERKSPEVSPSTGDEHAGDSPSVVQPTASASPQQGQSPCAQPTWPGGSRIFTDEQQRMIDSVLDGFDFAKVHQAMIALGHVWPISDTAQATPSIYRIVSEARRLLGCVVIAADTEGDPNYIDNYYCLHAESRDGKLTLQYIIAESFDMPF